MAPRSTSDSDKGARGGAVGALVASIVMTGVVYALPAPYGRWLSTPFMWTSTLAHELGHGVAGWLVGGSFDRFVMYPDGSGLASVGGYSGRIARATVSAGGLVGPAVVAGCFFALGRRPGTARAAFYFLGGSLLLLFFLVVRNPFGWFWVAATAALCLTFAARGGPLLVQWALVFLAVQLSLSVFSRGDYLFSEVARTGSGDFPSDVANMADALFLPYWFWGATCGAFSVAVLVVGVWVFLRSARSAHVEPHVDAARP